MKNNYPRGKFNESDEGELTIAIALQDKTIIIDFGKNIKWIGMDKVTALNLASLIIDKANQI